MIAQNVFDEVCRLLATKKHSRREVAKLTHVSRGTVNAIAYGKLRPSIYGKSIEEELFDGPPERCPECGGFVYMPCRLCRARRLWAGKPVVSDLASIKNYDGPPLGLDLHDDLLERYEEVRQKRFLDGEETQRPETEGEIVKDQDESENQDEDENQDENNEYEDDLLLEIYLASLLNQNEERPHETETILEPEEERLHETETIFEPEEERLHETETIFEPEGGVTL